jgi:hypothetical protein
MILIYMERGVELPERQEKEESVIWLHCDCEIHLRLLVVAPICEGIMSI